MGIKVKPEGRDGIYIVTNDEAVRFVEGLKGERFHSYLGDFPILVGCDHDRDSVIEHLKTAETIAFTIPGQMKHSLVSIEGSDADGWSRYLWDVGEIDVSMLDIVEESDD